MLANLVWYHFKSCREGVVAFLYLEGGKTGIVFCDRIGGLITGWADRQRFSTVTDVAVFRSIVR